jgi:hypothetical protein
MSELIALYFVSVLLALMAILFTYHRHVFSVKLLAFLLIAIILVEGVGLVLKHYGYSHRSVYKLYGPTEYIFIGYLYASHFRNQRACQIVIISIGLFLLLSITESFLLPNYFKARFNFLLRSLLIISLVLYYFYELYTDDLVLRLQNEPLFWISVGNFFFYTGTFFVMGLVAKLEKVNFELSEKVFLINPMLNIFLYSMFTVGFLCKPKIPS